MFHFLALDETFKEFKEKLKICIMGETKTDLLVSSLRTSGYEKIHQYGSTKNVNAAEFEDYEVWILLPPDKQTGSKYMESLLNNLRYARNSSNLKLAIYCDFDQLWKLCNLYELNYTQSIKSILRELKNQPKRIKDIKGNFLNELICLLNAEGTVFIHSYYLHRLQHSYIEI